MKKNRSYSNKAQMARLILVNLVVTMLTFVAMSLIMSVVSLKLDLHDEIIYYATFSAIAVVAVANGFFLSREIKSKGWLVGLLSNVILTVGMIIGHLISDEKRFDKYFAIKLAVILVMGVIGGIVGVNKKKKFK